ncbi:MAG: type 11 methyltransferase [Herpetosiphonaceae bacterium]|nr:MAG: type 11 methyltransferase [Herpetosiphonaceae bacterium]
MFRSYAPIYEAIGEDWLSLRLLHQVRRWLACAGIRPQSAADLACGTGAVAVALALDGLRVTGVDRSPEMLALARQRATAAGASVAWLQQDLRDLELPYPVDLMTAFYDSLNYLLSASDLHRVIERASRALAPGGILAFDLNTPLEYNTWIGGRNIVAYDGPELFVVSRRTFDPQTRLATGRIIWMLREGDHWRRGEEIQQQRAHEEADVIAALSAARLTLRSRLTLLGEPADAQATRILYLSQKPWPLSSPTGATITQSPPDDLAR